MSDEPNILGPCGNPHDFAIVGSRHLPESSPPMSVVLYRCKKCKIHTSVLHHGLWDLIDFVRSDGEIEELARMMK